MLLQQETLTGLLELKRGKEENSSFQFTWCSILLCAELVTVSPDLSHSKDKYF